MKLIETKLKDCYIIEPAVFEDNRGYFSPYLIMDDLRKNNLKFGDVVQCNRSLSQKGTLRGLHFQKGDKAQAKIVECLSGKLLDVIVDIREYSPTFGKWTSILLDSTSHQQILIPRGFAHGLLSLEDNTIFQYIVDNDYAKEYEDGIIWNDRDLCIDWGLEKFGISKPILSDKDLLHQSFANYKENILK